MYSVFLFFFQAEDGIRDFHVTGVQTCALPIYPEAGITRKATPACTARRARQEYLAFGPLIRRPPPWRTRAPRKRSEERRVGQACRSWKLPQHVNDSNELRDLP